MNFQSQHKPKQNRNKKTKKIQKKKKIAMRVENRFSRQVK